MPLIDRRQLTLAMLAAPTLARAQELDRIEVPFSEALGVPWTTLQFEGFDPLPVTFDAAYYGVTLHPGLALPTVGQSWSARGMTVGVARNYTVGGRLEGVGDLGFSVGRRFEGSPVAGALGLMLYQMFEFDWEGRRWIVGEGDPPRGAVRQRTNRPANMLKVRAELDGEPLDLWLNPALEEGLVLRRRASERLRGRLRERREETNPLDDSTSIVARAGRLSIEGLTIDRPIVRLHGDDMPYHWYWWHPSVDGIIGYDLLKRLNFRWSQLDQVVWLAPNGRMGEPFRDDRAGLQLRAYGEYLRVVGITPGSAGEQAGLRLGDEIVGHGPSGEVRGLGYALTQPAGTTVDLEVLRGDEVMRVPVVLQDRF